MSTLYNIEVTHNGETQRFTATPDQTILAAAVEAGLELPSSCLSGVCTTCAAKIIAGEIDQPDAMGVSSSLQEQGFALLCVSYARSDLKIEAGQEDQLYELQFGQFQN